MDTRYITSAAKPEQLPEYELPELAFIGRSNTGKSSLLNALLGRRNLARHGRTPGQTQMINFFSVNTVEDSLSASETYPEVVHLKLKLNMIKSKAKEAQQSVTRRTHKL